MPGTRPETAAAGSVVPGAPASGQTVPGGAQRTEGVVVTVEAREARLVDERRIPTEAYDPLKDLVNYRRPPVTLLEDYVSDSEVSDEEIFENKTRIEETLRNFGIPIQRIKATVGPTVTLYEIVQKQGGQDRQDTGPPERHSPEPQGRIGHPHHRADSGPRNDRHRGPEPQQAGRVDVLGRPVAALPGVEGRACRW